MNNRQFKFRAWCPHEKKWLAYFQIGQCGEVYEEIHAGFGPCDSFRHPDCVLQQFIGISDINGKEIYEGDIIKQLYFNSDNGRIGREIKEGIFEVKYETLVDSHGTCYIGFQIDSIRNIDARCEVIGNIFENPELIK